MGCEGGGEDSDLGLGELGRATQAWAEQPLLQTDEVGSSHTLSYNPIPVSLVPVDKESEEM